MVLKIAFEFICFESIRVKPPSDNYTHPGLIIEHLNNVSTPLNEKGKRRGILQLAGSQLVYM